MLSWKGTKGSFARSEIVLRKKLNGPGVNFFDIAKHHSNVNSVRHIEIRYSGFLLTEVCCVVVIMIKGEDKDVL